MGVHSEAYRLATTLGGSQWKFKSADNMQFYLKYLRSPVDARPPLPLYARCHVEQRSIAGRPVFHLRPRQQSSSSKKHVVFLHGGSFVNPMALIHWQFIQRLMKETSCEISVPLYGLIPKYNYRDAYELLKQHYRLLLKDHPPEDIVVMGDSAGGGLALGFAQWAPTQDLPRPGGLVMISPWLDITLSNPDIDQVQPRDTILAAPGNREAGRIWAAGREPTNPQLSPMYGPLDKLPPLCLFIGTDDILLPDARLLRDKVRATDTRLEYHEYPGMFHIWALLPTQEGFDAMNQIRAYVSQMGGSGQYTSAGSVAFA